MHARTLFVACYLFVLINDSTFIWTDLISPTNLWYFFLHIFCIGIRYGFFMRRVRRKEKMKKKIAVGIFVCLLTTKSPTYAIKSHLRLAMDHWIVQVIFRWFFFSFFVAFYLMLRQHNFCCFFCGSHAALFFSLCFSIYNLPTRDNKRIEIIKKYTRTSAT